MQKCHFFCCAKKFWRKIQSGLEAIEIFLEVTIYVLHTVVTVSYGKIKSACAENCPCKRLLNDSMGLLSHCQLNCNSKCLPF